MSDDLLIFIKIAHEDPIGIFIDDRQECPGEEAMCILAEDFTTGKTVKVNNCLTRLGARCKWERTWLLWGGYAFPAAVLRPNYLLLSFRVRTLIDSTGPRLLLQCPFSIFRLAPDGLFDRQVGEYRLPCKWEHRSLVGGSSDPSLLAPFRRICNFTAGLFSLKTKLCVSVVHWRKQDRY